ncbi:MAG: filamentous hemagglutinin family protein [Rhizobacter sp.]
MTKSHSIPSIANSSQLSQAELWRPTPVALAVSLALSMWPAVPAWAQKAPLPVICVGAVACGGKGFDPSRPSYVPDASAANKLVINQGSATSAIFNWQSFNIDKGNTVQFIQPSANAVALNRIFDNKASTIDGALKANGQIYLINPNGIFFNANARVDVGGLIASTLNLNDSRVTRGLLSETDLSIPVFSTQGDLSAAADAPDAGKIRVMPGAQIYAAGRTEKGTVVSAGRVFLFAPDVSNGGEIKVDGGGQVILAAGSKVFLGSTSDPTLRGLLVEVADGVKVENTGKVTTARGNITMMGLAVNQSGTLTATSAIRENGSIRLIAREVSAATGNTANTSPVGSLFAASKTGVVTLDSGSTTRVLLDASDIGTAALNDASAAAARSSIAIEGGAVNIGGSDTSKVTLVEAHGGDIAVTARQDVSTVGYQYGGAPGDATVPAALLGTRNDAAIVNVGANAVLDASGLKDVTVDGSRNFVYIERLTSNDMRDTSLQRDGFLRGKGVYMNVAVDNAFIDNSARRAAVVGTQAERNAVGGTVALRAEGAVNLAQGSVVDVSGGSTHTTAGQGRTSQLLTSTGQVVDIMKASASQQYVGFADQYTVSVVSPDEGINKNVTYQAPRFSAVGGFSSGMAAGSVEITAPRAAVDGSLVAHTTVMPLQGATPPTGGELRIGSAASATLALDAQAQLSRASILLGNDAAALRAGLSDDQLQHSMVLDTDALRRNGFSRMNLTSDGQIVLAASSALDLGVGGQFSAKGNLVSVNSNISAAGGSITLAERPVTSVQAGVTVSADQMRDAVADVSAVGNQRGTVALGADVKLSTAGLWTNESQLPANQLSQQPVMLNGGTISVSGRVVDVSRGSFDVSAGARLSPTGAISGGKAGSLSVGAADSKHANGLFEGQLVLGEDFASRIAGFGVTGSGSLSISAPHSAVLSTYLADAGNATWLDANGLGTRGFSRFNFNALERLDVATGTTFTPEVRLLQPTADLRSAPSSAHLVDLVQPQLPLLPTQPLPTQISLGTTDLFGGVTTVGRGAVVNAGTLGSVSVVGGSQAEIDGSLVAQGGSVSVGLLKRGANDTFTDAEIQSRSVHLVEAAHIDVSGVSRVITGVDGRRSGDVLDAGRIDLGASYGRLTVDAKARIDAHGVVDQVTPKGSVAATQVVASAGGAVSLQADVGLSVSKDSVVNARGGDANALGGRLSVQLQRIDSNVLGSAWSPEAQATLLASHQLLIDDSGVAAPVAGQGQISPTLVNQSGFDQTWLASSNSVALGGVVALTSKGSLSIDAQSLDASGNSARSLNSKYVSIGAGVLGQAALAETGQQANPPATGGSATLTVNADNIDLVGRFALNGIGDASLNAKADVRGVGLAPGSLPAGQTTDTRPTGEFKVGGNLSIKAAQVYPATYTDFSFSSNAAPDAIGQGVITVTRATDSGVPLAPLSAGGRLAIHANDVIVDGRIAAPLGSIDLQGERSVVLSAGAELSAQGVGTVPFGTVTSGSRWTYNWGNTIATITDAQGVNVPDKGVRIQAATVDVQAGAKVNVAGGGQLLGTEFVAGPGGSFDMTQNFPLSTDGSGARNTLFALLPSRGTALAPFDPQTYRDLSLNGASNASSVFTFGQTITLGAGSGVPAGTYTVLPARYAVLPGAFAVQPASGHVDMLPSQAITEAAGTVIVAGRLGLATTDGGSEASRWSGYRVFNGTQFRALSELKDYNGDSFISPFAAVQGAAPRLARDAGSLAIGADNMRLAGDVSAAPAAGGQGADVSLTAPHIEIAPVSLVVTQPSDVLQLAATQLNALGAQTLLLGATADAKRQDGGATLSTQTAHAAQTVNLQGGAALEAGEVILTASDRVSTGVGSGLNSSAVAPATRTLKLSGDGATLWVSASSSEALNLTRSDAQGSQGSLSVGIGSTVGGHNGASQRAGNALFDASLQQQFGAGLDLRSEGFSLSGTSINLGEVPEGTPGLNLNGALLDKFSSANRLTLASGGGFNTYGSAQIGGTDANGQPLLDVLRLKGQGFQGQGGAGDSVQLTARHLVLDNSQPNAQVVVTPGIGQGSLTLRAVGATTSAGDVSVAGVFATSGFDQVNVQAASALRFKGGVADAATLDAGTARLTVDAGTIAAQRGVHGALSTSGELTVSATAAAPAVRTQEAGATLALSGSSVDFGGRISVPGGVVSLNATGSNASDNVTLRSGSLIDAAGQIQSFGPTGIATAADLSAGSIALNSQAGSVQALVGSTIDLSGAGNNGKNGAVTDIGTRGDAGALSISAPNGEARLQGDLLTVAGSAARGADLSIDAKTLGNMGEISSALNTGSTPANTPTEARSINLRARQGDIVVGANDSLNAEKITLAADGAAGASDGSIRIDGKLSANGNSLAGGNGNGGRIQVYAHNAIVLGAGGEIEAMSRQQGDVAADGGQVMLSARITNEPSAPTDSYAVSLQPGARINVSGHDGAAQSAVQGQVTLRSRRLVTPQGDDVDVAQLPANAISGGKTIVEGVVLEEFGGDKTFAVVGSVPVLNAEQKLLQAYMSISNQNAMASRLLGQPTVYASSSSFSLRPGLEIRTTGNLTLNAELDLAKATSGAYNWRYGGSTTATSDPGALTLRAGGNLALNESISDGFTSAAATATVFAKGDSWRYGFTAGSDLTASNARQTSNAATGSLTVGRAADTTALGAVIRTGTGSISMDAAQDVTLMNNSSGPTALKQGQAVYTAGVQVSDIPAGTFPTLTPARAAIVNPVLTSGGGDLDVSAGRNIAGGGPNDVLGSAQSVNEWLWRGGLGTTVSPSVQWVNFGQFQQNWGVLGGGSLSLQAQGDIVRANAMVAANSYVAGNQENHYNTGSLDVRAGGTILQGMFYDEAGRFDIDAARIAARPDGGLTDGTRLAMGSNSVNVQVREQAVLAMPFNPTAYAPSKLLTPRVTGVDDYQTTYFTYAPASRFSLRAAAGDVGLLAAQLQSSSPTLLLTTDTNPLRGVTPPNLDLIAFGGAIDGKGTSFTPLPAADSGVRVLADGNVSGITVAMSQADLSQLPAATSPFRYSSLDQQALGGKVTSVSTSAVPLHAIDTTPSAIVSRDGSISGLVLGMVEATEVHASGTLSSSEIQVQNQSSNAITRISAGKGIDLSGPSWIVVSGAGAAEVVSGGPINLGDDPNAGILSKGNLLNPNLPAQGASLLVAAGTGLAPNGFATRPNYLNAVTQFLRNDAFASAGASADALNAEVIAILRKPGAEAGSIELAKVLEEGLAHRSAIDDPTSNVARALNGGLSAASMAVGTLRLASAVQEVTNTRFVQTHNTDTFAAGYAAFNDLFPNLANSAAGLRSFVGSNPFAVSANAASLRAQVIDGLRAQGGSAVAVADALALGVANPVSANDPDSAYSRAVAALTPDQLQTGGRALLAQTLVVAGTDLDRLRAADKVDAGAGTPYARTLTDLAAAYAPLGLRGSNDLGMAASDIKVEQTGQLSLLAPRGSVLVGQPVAVLSKSPSDLGLFTLGGGSITAMVRDNVDVYRSRVFTVAGGDIALWSSLGNIDAGRGKTDAAVVPPPRLVLDSKTGIPKLDLGGAVTGSGIGALVSDANQPAGDVTLVAPKGFIDAGEAGIRADRGKVTLGADIVLNSGAIKASGGVEGGKVVVAPPAPVPATASGNQANDAVEQTQRNLSAQQSEAQERAKKERRKRVTGEFIGFGDD